ncbi:DUF58 domain-containing protein [Verrucomicrobiota bacterium sgz303538]
MIVPQPRLIWWAALILVPFAIVAGTVAGAPIVAAGVIGLFLVIVLVDLMRAPRHLKALSAVCPPVVRLQKGRDSSIELELHHEKGTVALLRIGLPLPDEVGAESVDRTLRLSAGTERSVLSWPCRPKERGKFLLESVQIEVPSPLGFWAARKGQAVKCELRVYPDLLKERSHLAALFLRRPQAGMHVQAFAGQGREFEKLRAYQSGDSLADIHWKATAKRRTLVSKVFQVERTQEVYVVIDASRLSARAAVAGELSANGVEDDDSAKPVSESEAVEGSILERYITGALLLGYAAEQQGDQFGLLTFSDRVHSFVRARNGQAHFDAVRDQLYTLQPNIVSPDYEELFSFIRLRLRKRALLVILTSLDDPVLAESFVKASELISRQHLVLVDMLRRPGIEPVFESSEGVRQPGDLYGKLAGHFQWHQLRELEKVLKRRGIRFSLLDPEAFAADLIAQHAYVRARQLL